MLKLHMHVLHTQMSLQAYFGLSVCADFFFTRPGSQRKNLAIVTFFRLWVHFSKLTGQISTSSQQCVHELLLVPFWEIFSTNSGFRSFFNRLKAGIVDNDPPPSTQLALNFGSCNSLAP